MPEVAAFLSGARATGGCNCPCKLQRQPMEIFRGDDQQQQNDSGKGRAEDTAGPTFQAGADPG